MRQALNHSYRFLRRAKSVRTLCIRLPKVVLFLFLLLGVGSLAAQNTDQQIAAQKRLIADLEKQIAREEQEISKLKKGRASAEETVRRAGCPQARGRGSSYGQRGPGAVGIARRP